MYCYVTTQGRSVRVATSRSSAAANFLNDLCYVLTIKEKGTKLILNI